MKLTETDRTIRVSFVFDLEDVAPRPHPYSRTGGHYQPQRVRVDVRDGSVDSSVRLSGPVVLKGGALSDKTWRDENIYAHDKGRPDYVLEAIERSLRATRKHVPKESK